MPQSTPANGRRYPLEAGENGHAMGGVANLPTRAKVERLLKTTKGRRRPVVLTHDNPDPDSMAAAVALAFLLERRGGMAARVGYGGIIGRAENIAFVKVLRLPVSPISQ